MELKPGVSRAGLSVSVVLAAYLVSGCASQEISSPTSTESSTAIVTVPELPTEQNPIIPDAPVAFTTEPIAIPTAQAERNDNFPTTDGGCAKQIRNIVDRATACYFQETGVMSLVYFDGISAEKAEAIADRSEQLVHEASGGIMTPDVVAVPASEAANTYFAHKTAEMGCVDDKNADTWGSTAAGLLMPAELAESKAVIGLNAQHPCRPLTLGAAEPEYKMVAEVFMDSENTPTTTIVNATAHEILHLSRLGHDQAIACDRPEGLVYGQMFEDDAPQNLVTLASSCFYDEYSEISSNVMGGVEQEETLGLNTIQKGILSEPRDVMQGVTDGPGTMITETWSRFDAQSIEANDFARIDAGSPPITISELVVNLAEKPSSTLYTELAIVPKVADESALTVTGAEVFLVSASNETLSLGTVALEPGETTRSQTIIGSGVAVELQLQDGVLQVRRLSE